MTTLISNAAAPATTTPAPESKAAAQTTRVHVKREHTFASRVIFLTICVAIVLTTLAFGTVHYWALSVFALSAAIIVCLIAADAWRLRSIQLSPNPLQFVLGGMIVLGLVQLLPLRAAPDMAGLPLTPSLALSLDPYATRLVIVQVTSLFIYFVATLIFTDTPDRLKLLVRTIIIFGFLLAGFGLTQSFATGGTRVYWFRELAQSTAFGPFINRHHFAGYMEMTIALPLGLLFSGAIDRDKRPLYIFAAILMGVGLIMTNSRGGMISLGAEIVFLVIVASIRPQNADRISRIERARAAMLRAGLAFALVVLLIGGVFAIGGSDSFSRLLGTPSAADPTTGRAHFWNVTLDIIKAHPIVGTGLGAFGVVYTRYDSHNGLLRLEQAHNDYLQILSDGGIVGAALGLGFIVILFRKGFSRRESKDRFRSGVATGALAGCFAVLIHSFFDFTLHTTANALLFLVLAALATQDSRVERSSGRRRRRSRAVKDSPELPQPASPQLLNE
jgi:O-antigen ligase